MEQILLHVCCGPDLTYSYVHFSKEYCVRALFTNNNIDSSSEFEKRAEQAAIVGEKLGFEVETDEYAPHEFYSRVKGMEDMPEQGERCMLCHRMNLERTAGAAKEKAIRNFSTTLTISPHKNADRINEMGREIGEAYGVNFVSEILRKDGGFAKSVEMSKEMKLYRQNYCGCKFSRRDCG